MSAPLRIGTPPPPAMIEYVPPSHTALQYAPLGDTDDPAVRELINVLAEEARQADLYQAEVWKTLADGINWAGPRRVKDDRLYRYHEAAGEWLSFDRAYYLFGSTAGAGPFWADMVGGITTSNVIGYHLPQDCTVIRWWANWQGGGLAANDEVNLNLNGNGVHDWVAAGGETSMEEEAPDIVENFAKDDFFGVSVFPETNNRTDYSFTVEVAWRTTFEA